MGYEPDGPREEMVYPGRGDHGQHQDPDRCAGATRRRWICSTRASSSTTKASRRTTEGRGEFREGAGDRSQRTARPRCIWAAPTTRCSMSRRPRQAFPQGDRDRSGLSGSARELRRHAAGHGRRGRIDPAVERGDCSAIRRTRMALYLLAQAYRMKELYPQSIESARAAIKLNPSNRRTALLAGREPAAEREVRRRRRPNTRNICG